MSKGEDRRIAAHEAGHVTAAYLLGREYGAALYDSGGVAGTDLSEPAMTFYNEDQLHATYRAKPVDSLLEDIVVFAAGTVAEALDRGAVYGTVPPIVTGPDAQAIEAAGLALASKFPSNEVGRAFVAVAFYGAWRLVCDHVEAIRRIADALEIKRRLSAAEVAEIFASTDAVLTTTV